MRWVQGENYEWGKYKRKEWKKKKKEILGISDRC